MASVSVSAHVPAAPEKAWDLLCDLSRWDEWLTMHVKWKGEIPTEIGTGTTITQVVSVMGMANKIEWNVDEYDAPRLVRISGTGMAGVKVEFVLSVAPEGEGSSVTIDASFTGTMIVGPIGKAVAKNARADLETSIAKFTDLLG
ncbi:type II toxin-antitoxin system Rv0910 family toxin [Lolliginicoccus levis]|uniref:type II toxin-antitoxin system Rv0910 family toxin n=1 Tax=Lolliginicoccus levis TaxID=2919542 RepID=UPI00241D8946|nr:SRPBCC family protein [Lolliginicoccus levis]